EQRHEKIEFVLRPFPVFAAEAVQRKLADDEPAALLDGGADALNAAGVALDARQAALPGPAAVAVHDYGDVRRQPRRVESGLGQPAEGGGVETGVGIRFYHCRASPTK